MTSEKQITDLTFEEAFRELESIVTRLEATDSVTLDDSILLYERGVKLRQRCEKILAQAKLRIDKVIGVTQDHEPVTEPFDHPVSQ